MGDKTEEQNHEVEAKHQSESEPSTMTMAEIETPQDEGKPSLETLKKLDSLLFSIWPPTQKTRDAVIERLIETLSSPASILSKRYGTIPRGNASDIAMRIEEEAFNAAGASANADGGDGIEILQVYSKEVSKRMLEGIKSRSADSQPPEILPETESVPAPQESNKLYALLETVAPEAAP